MLADFLNNVNFLPCWIYKIDLYDVLIYFLHLNSNIFIDMCTFIVVFVVMLGHTIYTKPCAACQPVVCQLRKNGVCFMGISILRV
jgi:hypothetical protein